MNRTYRSRGFSLVELMVAMVLGLVLIGGVVSVLMANKRSYRTNEGLSQVQETARSAYELIARDVRQSGTTGCDNARKMGNIFDTPTGAWWKQWEGIHGFDNTEVDSAVAFGTGADKRVSGTDSLRLRGIDGLGFPIESHSTGSGQIVLQTANSTATSFNNSEEMIICDFNHSTMFMAGNYTGASRTIAYSLTGNSTTGMGFPTNPDGSSGNVYQFQKNAWVGRLGATDWYIGNNSRGGRSLYRIRLDSNSTLVTEEVVAGVTDMQIRYGVNGSDTIDVASAVAAGDWAKVNSVFITLSIDSTETNVSTDTSTNSGKLNRTYTYIITMRNRVT
jgi:type IV pilus assembly protein PilW